MTSQPLNLVPGSGLYVAALLDAADRAYSAGFGSKSQAAFRAYQDIGAVILAYHGQCTAWAGRMPCTPGAQPFPHEPDSYFAARLADVQALDAAAQARLAIDRDDLAGAVMLESEIEAVQGQISAIEYGGNTGTRETAPAALARLGAELAALKARRPGAEPPAPVGAQ